MSCLHRECGCCQYESVTRRAVPPPGGQCYLAFCVPRSDGRCFYKSAWTVNTVSFSSFLSFMTNYTCTFLQLVSCSVFCELHVVCGCGFSVVTATSCSAGGHTAVRWLVPWLMICISVWNYRVAGSAEFQPYIVPNCFLTWLYQLAYFSEM